jgi:hypothetical protein
MASFIRSIEACSEGFLGISRVVFKQVIYSFERPIVEMTINSWKLEFPAFSLISFLSCHTPTFYLLGFASTLEL